MKREEPTREEPRLHATLTSTNLSATKRKQIFKQLSAIYNKLNIPELNSIGNIYEKAR